MNAFKSTLKIKLSEEKLMEKEREIVDKIILNKYNSDEWNIKGISGNG